ncbi:hypothetical protein AX17_006599 [Amanita inopinata Kibby_2008]|nr:hypothetical protein AX17_006599 [Amanita inopinata Kibby_2008]
MATRGPIVQNQQAMQLCDFCHQKAKFSNHQFCSKTCAAQASSLCKHCLKKPKFQNFDYCGKNCAALASVNGTVTKPPRANPAVAIPVQQQQPVPAPANNASKGKSTFNPVQVAKLVAQHIPQVQALIGASSGAGAVSSTQPAAQVVASVAVPPAAKTSVDERYAGESGRDSPGRGHAAACSASSVSDSWLHKVETSRGGGYDGVGDTLHYVFDTAAK